MKRISEVTRRDLFDAMTTEDVVWSGRLEEPEFLSRIYDLKSIRSNDDRYTNASGDIYQHRIANADWGPFWIYVDPRFDLADGDDEVLLRFLCETIHPVVRSDSTEAERLRLLYNRFLVNDGYEISERARLSGKPVFGARDMSILASPNPTQVAVASQTAKPDYVEEITRPGAVVEEDRRLEDAQLRNFDAELERLEGLLAPPPKGRPKVHASISNNLVVEQARRLFRDGCRAILLKRGRISPESLEDLVTRALHANDSSARPLKDLRALNRVSLAPPVAAAASPALLALGDLPPARAAVPARELLHEEPLKPPLSQPAPGEVVALELESHRLRTQASRRMPPDSTPLEKRGTVASHLFGTEERRVAWGAAVALATIVNWLTGAGIGASVCLVGATLAIAFLCWNQWPLRWQRFLIALVAAALIVTTACKAIVEYASRIESNQQTSNEAPPLNYAPRPTLVTAATTTPSPAATVNATTSLYQHARRTEFAATSSVVATPAIVSIPSPPSASLPYGRPTPPHVDTHGLGYDYKGSLFLPADRSSKSGYQLHSYNAEYFRMRGLALSRDWPALRAVAETLAKNVPDWVTPDIYTGEARLFLGDCEGSRELLESARQRIGDNQMYAGIVPLLDSLLERRCSPMVQP